MRLGTYTTYDAPTSKIDEARTYLDNQFNKIGGQARQVMNDHDFGGYPSFEIDYPSHLELVDLDDDDPLDDELELIDEKEKWIDEANKIEASYNKKFEKYL